MTKLYSLKYRFSQYRYSIYVFYFVALKWDRPPEKYGTHFKNLYNFFNFRFSYHCCARPYFSIFLKSHESISVIISPNILLKLINWEVFDLGNLLIGYKKPSSGTFLRIMCLKVKLISARSNTFGSSDNPVKIRG